MQQVVDTFLCVKICQHVYQSSISSNSAVYICIYIYWYVIIGFNFMFLWHLHKASLGGVWKDVHNIQFQKKIHANTYTILGFLLPHSLGRTSPIRYVFCPLCRRTPDLTNLLWLDTTSCESRWKLATYILMKTLYKYIIYEFLCVYIYIHIHIHSLY